MAVGEAVIAKYERRVVVGSGKCARLGSAVRYFTRSRRGPPMSSVPCAASAFVIDREPLHHGAPRSSVLWLCPLCTCPHAQHIPTPRPYLAHCYSPARSLELARRSHPAHRCAERFPSAMSRSPGSLAPANDNAQQIDMSQLAIVSSATSPRSQSSSPLSSVPASPHRSMSPQPNQNAEDMVLEAVANLEADTEPEEDGDALIGEAMSFSTGVRAIDQEELENNAYAQVRPAEPGQYLGGLVADALQ